MQAARTILKAIPDSKIIFLSQETSTDFVDEALRLGALAYVIKVNAGTDLRRAIESVQKRKELTMSAAAQMREQSES
jgi:DNA-binding NarL/FixJ family response regulator